MLAGCQSPKFAYHAPPAILKSTGPRIAVLPLVDCRTNHDEDQILEKGYFADVQKAVGDELKSMNFFSSVTLMTNDASPLLAELQLSPTLRRLDWEIPHYGRLQAEAFAVGLVTGLVGGGVFLATGIDVYGHSDLDVSVRRISDGNVLLNLSYSDTVTNRLKKAVCDTPKTQASMMVQAFQKTIGELKTDLQKQLSQETNTSSPSRSEGENK
jgi:hypothetical protein